MNKETKYIVSFSGGKDSTAMLLKLIEQNRQIDEIIFCDTGLEFPEIINHIKKVEQYINRKITIVKPEKDFEYYLLNHIKTKGKNKGKAGFGWPFTTLRWCNAFLKRDPIKNYYKKYKDINIIQYIRISYDEHKRVKENPNIIYPLVELKITDAEAYNYCLEKGFDWEGLYNRMPRTGCYLCPLQRINTLKILYIHYPELWANMKRLDKLCIEQLNRQFRKDYNIEELEIKFKAHIPPLF